VNAARTADSTRRQRRWIGRLIDALRATTGKGEARANGNNLRAAERSSAQGSQHTISDQNDGPRAESPRKTRRPPPSRKVTVEVRVIADYADLVVMPTLVLDRLRRKEIRVMWSA
jgi:hypothetical protein